MNLAAYLETRKITAISFARKLGVSKALISHIVNGRRRPSPDTAKGIERLTNGEVPKHILRPDIWDAPKRRAA